MTSKRNLVVIGWGRMGVTHTSIINGLYPGLFDITIVEPNKKLAQITRKTLGYKVVNSISETHFKNSLVLITTPPLNHSELSKPILELGAERIFIEKPFGLHDKRVNNDSKIFVGYVLRYSEVVQSLKKIIAEEGCKKIRLDYSSYTLTKKPNGWRNSSYGGVLNEMGSHLIDLILYLGDNNEVFDIHFCDIESVISDVDDIVLVKGMLGNIEVEISLNWVNPNFRKPVWSGMIKTLRRDVYFDQQSIDDGFHPINVGYYVRGRDFSLQMKHFVEGNQNIVCSSDEANKVHDIITKIKQKA